MATHQEHLFVENPEWMKLSPAQQKVEREKTLTKLGSWWPVFRKVALVAPAIFISA